MIACILLAWLRLLALDGDLAAGTWKPSQPGPGQMRSSPPGTASRPSPKHPDQKELVPPSKEQNPGDRGTPGHPARQPGYCHTPTLNPDPQARQPVRLRQPSAAMKDQG